MSLVGTRLALVMAAGTLAATPAGARAQDTAAFPAFALENYDGRPISNATFDGKITIVVPTYAKCVFACPVVTFFLAELDTDLGSPDRLQYLHVSVQPEEDTAEEIRLHFDKHEIDATRDPRWLFANGPPAGIQELLMDLGIEVTRTPVPDGMLVEHTIRLYVVGPDGSMLASFDTYFWNEEEMRHALATSLD